MNTFKNTSWEYHALDVGRLMTLVSSKECSKPWFGEEVPLWASIARGSISLYLTSEGNTHSEKKTAQ